MVADCAWAASGAAVSAVVAISARPKRREKGVTSIECLQVFFDTVSGDRGGSAPSRLTGGIGRRLRDRGSAGTGRTLIARRDWGLETFVLRFDDRHPDYRHGIGWPRSRPSAHDRTPFPPLRRP